MDFVVKALNVELFIESQCFSRNLASPHDRRRFSTSMVPVHQPGLSIRFKDRDLKFVQEVGEEAKGHDLADEGGTLTDG